MPRGNLVSGIACRQSGSAGLLRRALLPSTAPLLGIWLGFSAVPAAAQSSACATASLPTYFYDAGGRLSAVLSSTGSTSNYSYDRAGNILSVTQNASSTTQVLQVCPNAAPVGTSVTIWGTGFAGSPAVAFGGIAAPGATVVSANEIIVAVPAGASTGIVTVTPSGGSAAVAPSAFNVAPVSPQITGISTPSGMTISGYTVLDPFPFYGAATAAQGSPAVGSGGTQTLTISGSGFDSTMPLISTQNKVWIGAQAATIQSATATALTVSVPVSGSVIKNGAAPVVTVLTPNGKATYSAQSVLITPGGVTPFLINQKSTAPGASGLTLTAGVDSSEIDAITDGLTVGGLKSLTFATAATSHFAAFMFSGIGGSFINAQTSVCSGGQASCSNGYTKGAIILVAPDGSEVSAADLGGSYPPTVAAQNESFWRLPVTGTYTIYVQNSAGKAGAAANVALAAVPAAQNLGSFSVPSTPSGTISGFQSASFTFNVASGSNGRVTLTTNLASALASPFVVSVTGPDHFTQVYSNGKPKQGDATGFVAPGQVDFSGPIAVPATQAGVTYTVTYQSLSAGSSNVTFSLVSLPNDTEVGGSGCNGSWPTNATVTCSGTIASAGQGIYATITGAPPVVAAIQTNAASFAGCFEVLLTDTGLNQQFYRSVQCGGSDFSYPLQFPIGSAGPYQLQAFGIGQNTGTLTFSLTAATANVATAHAVVGTPKTVAFTYPGQSATVVLGAQTAGNWVTFGTSEPSGWTQCYVVSINTQGNPSQPFGTYFQCPTGVGGSLGEIQLPAASPSNYDINITPAGIQTGSITTTVSAGTAPASGTLPVNGSVYAKLSSAGTSYSYSFTPTIGPPGYVDLITIPNITANQVVPSQGCFETQILSGATTIFDSAQEPSIYVGYDGACSSLSVSAAQALASAGGGTVNFLLNNASQTGVGNFGQTLYNYNANTYANTLAIGAGGPVGVTLASALPGQPAVVAFASSASNNFVNVVVGMDANLAAYCSSISIADMAAPTVLVFSDSTCQPAYSSGAVQLPHPGHTYQISVMPLGDSVGNVSIGVGAQ